MKNKNVIALILMSMMAISLVGCKDKNELREADKGIEIVSSNPSSVSSKSQVSPKPESVVSFASSTDSNESRTDSSKESNAESSTDESKGTEGYNFVLTSKDKPIKIGEWASYVFSYNGKNYNAEMRIVSINDDKDKIENDIKANSGNLPALYVMPDVSNGGLVEYSMECRVVDKSPLYSGYPFDKGSFEADGHPDIYPDSENRENQGNPFLPNVFLMDKDGFNHKSGDVIAFRLVHRTYAGYKDYVLSYNYNSGKAYFSVK